jgi:hypothetical protein
VNNLAAGINFCNFGGNSSSKGIGGQDMSTTTDRLALYEAILNLIEKRRLATKDESLGASIEQFIVDTQFRELEAEILEDPGAIEPWLIRRRRES